MLCAHLCESTIVLFDLSARLPMIFRALSAVSRPSATELLQIESLLLYIFFAFLRFLMYFTLVTFLQIKPHRPRIFIHRRHTRRRSSMSRLLDAARQTRADRTASPSRSLCMRAAATKCGGGA